MINIYNSLTKSGKELLSKELGLSLGELEMLNFDIRLVQDNEGYSVYKFILLGDNPIEVTERILDLDGDSVELPDYIFEIDDEDWYDYEYVSGKDPEENLDVFLEELENLEKLNKLNIKDRKMTIILKRQIFIGIIGSMETYLSDTFIGLVSSNITYLERFVSSHPEFAKRKFELKEVFAVFLDIEKTARNIMLEVIYHDLAKVREMYRKTFEIEFPSIRDAYKCVMVRHDLVHRNGKTKNRQPIALTEKSISQTLQMIRCFIEDLAGIISKLNDRDIDHDLPF
ncbi:hypothetical protein ACFE6N_04350 [Pedobacter sp. BG31]|uniref:hypothetical protein n=1 Tax=Pedobacter sp. BG31 TaxID=3349697 RepID=UPI0035F2782A